MENQDETRLSYQDKVTYLDQEMEAKLKEWSDKLGVSIKVAVLVVLLSIFILLMFAIRTKIKS